MNRRIDLNQHPYRRLHQVSVVINGFIIACIVALFALILVFPKGWSAEPQTSDHDRSQVSQDLSC
jgi:hypothetical protein